MSSTTLANQNSTISIKQKISISIDIEIQTSIEAGQGFSTKQLETIVSTANSQLDISAIILQVLGGYNTASLGNTDVSGELIADEITVDEISFESDGRIFDLSDIRFDISNLKTSVNYFSSIITEISTNLFILDNSTVKFDLFNDLSNSHYTLKNKVNDISFIFDNFELSNNRILVKMSMDISNLLITSNDFSFSYLNSLDSSDNFILSLKQLNELLGSYKFATTEDLSSINFDISSSFEYINDISQTFYEIMTQQPNKFKKPLINSTESSSSEIKITWNYDHLIANHNNSIYKAQLAYPSNNTIKLSQLPYIDKIIIDISGKYNDNTESGWLNLNTINIPLDICYNIIDYKSFIITKSGDLNNNINDINNILNNNYYFSLRVYGSNNAQDYPSIENRSLYYNYLKFVLAKIPSKPIIYEHVIINTTTINITFFVNNTEKDISNSNAKIKTLDISYILNDSLRTNYLPYNSSDYNSENKIINFTDMILQGIQFNENIINLIPGSRYYYQGRVKNNLNDISFSEYSDISLSNYTPLPNSLNNITSIDTSILGNKQYISNKTFSNNEIIYINLSNTNNIHNLLYKKLNQNFEITNPDALTNGINMKGYGKFLDNLPINTPLATLNVYVNDISVQTIIYDNSFGRNNAINSYSKDFIGLTSPTIEDIYKNDLINNGYRLKGDFTLYSLNINDIINKIGSASSNPYILKYEYLRHPDVNGSNSIQEYSIYIDDLSSNPEINNIDNSNNINQVIYNMGIPSVESFNLKFQRNYNNINSKNLYIVGNKIISKIENINKTNTNNEKNITLNNPDININGSYYFNYNDIENVTNNFYNNLNYTEAFLEKNSILSWNEKVYNLFNSNNLNNVNSISVPINYVINHYCDYNSFNKNNLKIINSKLNLTALHIYEINNMSELSNNIANLTLLHYNNHFTEIKNNTLLFINGKFQSNKTQIYPNLQDFSYNLINNTIINNYNFGNISYDLSGNITNISNNGYKFIVFQIKKSSGIQTASDYLFNNNGYSRINYDSKSYISIKSMLNDFFDSNTIDKLFDLNDNNAIGFIKVTLKLNNITRIGNLKKDYNPVGGDWLNNGSSPISYNGSLDYAYGCKVENINGDKGIVINPTAVNDDLTLFIGLKNN